ncbi:MAG: NHL repeat-containing protein, partial [Chloroflexota bacterium]
MHSRLTQYIQQHRLIAFAGFTVLVIGISIGIGFSGILDPEPASTPSPTEDSAALEPAPLVLTPDFADTATQPATAASTRTASEPSRSLESEMPPPGSVYLVDAGRGRVEVFDAAGTALYGWGREDVNAAIFDTGSAVAPAPKGDVYILDSTIGQVLRSTLGGSVVDSWLIADAEGVPALDPIDIAVDGNGDVYVLDGEGARIWKFTAEGEYLFVWGGRGAGPGFFDEPRSLAAGDESVIVLEQGTSRIQRFDTYGRLVGTLGVDESGLREPVAVSLAGRRIAVFDAEREEIFWFDSAGEIVDRIPTPAGFRTSALHGTES